jgi:dipeptidyl aminopeptidase/acylaminoacyl peptidase
MTEPTPEFESALEARVRTHLDRAVDGLDASAVAAAVLAEADRAQPVGRPQVRWLASPPARWRPVAAIAAALTVGIGALLVGGAPDRPSPSPSPTSAVVAPSVDPSMGPAPSDPPPPLRRLNANGSLTWSEDGGIVVVATDGSGHRVLEGLPGADGVPAWSPDGRWIAFANDDGDGGRLGLMLADGTDIRTAVDTDTGVGGIEWSPDGAWIAYTSTERRPSISVVHLATGRTTLVARGSNPAWAPDSRRLAFVGGGRPDTGIVVTEIDREPAFSTNDASDAAPDWSPMGDVIVFARGDLEGRGRIMAMAPDGGGLTPLTGPAEGSDGEPVFEPFGRHIAFDREFAQFGGDPSRGFVVDVADGEEREVFGSGWAGHAWSPDGQFLVADGQAALAVTTWRIIVDASTGEEAHRFETSQEATNPSWQPLPYSVSCGPLDQEQCRSGASHAVAIAMGQDPGKRVLRVELGSCAAYTVKFTDGTRRDLVTDCVPS